MLTEKEKQFMEYWEAAREKESGFGQKMRRGMPMALMFGTPILASVAAVYFFSPEWYTKISQSVSEVTVTVMIAVILFILFFSFTRMHFKWEMNEQIYQELKQKRNKEDAAKQNQH